MPSPFSARKACNTVLSAAWFSWGIRTTVPSANVNSIHGIDHTPRTGNRKKPRGCSAAGSLAVAIFARFRRVGPPRFFPERGDAPPTAGSVVVADASRK
jgi:hypothetical protein